jgi:hypothetical protein
LKPVLLEAEIQEMLQRIGEIGLGWDKELEAEAFTTS